MNDANSSQKVKDQNNLSEITERRFRIASTPQKNSDGPDAWVMTYMDLVTLLLTLFIFLLLNAGDGKAGSDKNENKNSEAITFEADGILSGSNNPIVVPDISSRKPSLIDALKNKLQQQIGQLGLNDGIEIEKKDGDLHIRFSEEVLFNSGEAYFNRHAMDAMRPVIKSLKENEFLITVEGHTDNVPIFNEKFSSNWELSSARATNLVGILIEEGISQNYLRAISYASTQPLESNDSEAGRQKNRRVTLVVSDNN